MQKSGLCLAALLFAILSGESWAAPGKCLFDPLRKQLGDIQYLKNESDPRVLGIENLMRAGKLAQSDRELRRLSSDKPDMAKAYLLSALVATKLLDFDRALASITKYIALRGQKNAGDGYWIRAQIYYLRGNNEEALVDYDKCLGTRDNTYALVALEEKGDLLMSLGRVKEARPILEKCVSLENQSDKRRYLGRILARGECYDKLGMYDQAIKDYTVYVAKVDALEPWLKYCRALVASGQRTKALSALNELLARHPSCHEALGIRADLKEKMGDDQGALQDIENLLKLYPRSAQWRARRKALIEKAGA